MRAPLPVLGSRDSNGGGAAIPATAGAPEHGEAAGVNPAHGELPIEPEDGAGLTVRSCPGGREVLAPDGSVLAAVLPNDWETRFFDRRIGSLRIGHEALERMPATARQAAVARAVAAADAAGFRLLQAQLATHHISEAASIEAAGFRLVDSRVEFLTRLERHRAPRHLPPFGEAGLARPQDREALLALAHEGLTANPNFHSRYKDPAYFTPEETARWFAAWVENDFADPGTLLAVWRVDGAPAAFFGYARRGEREGIPLYKSTLAVTAARWQGQKAHIFLQTALFDAIPADEFWVQGVTQADNGAVIRNNFTLGRRLQAIQLVFFRRGGA